MNHLARNLSWNRGRSTLLLIAWFVALAILPDSSWARESIDLSGQWRFRLDPNDAGEAERWFTQTLEGKIRLPGSLQEQGFGDDPSVATRWVGSIKDRSWFTAPEFEKFRQADNLKIPCWLQPEKHYVGPAWYQRDIELPASWNDKHVVLFLERCHWFTNAWIDGRHIGSGESLCVPHEFVLPEDLPAGKHTLTLRVDNRIRLNVGHDAHSISDHTQTNWNGVIGALRLTARPKVWIESVQVYPESKTNSVRVVTTIRNHSGQPSGTGQLRIRISATKGKHSPLSQTKPIRIEDEVTQCETELFFGKTLHSWNEFHPNLSQLEVTLDATLEGQKFTDQVKVSFGMRTVSSNGRRVTINERPIFLRGTLECCIFPETGYPPTDKASWKRIMEICRAHGLNQLRFHSWCPPEAAFQAADEFGFYLQVELPTWTYNLGKDKPRDDFLKRELNRVLDIYGNHPSFILMSMGNELRGTDEFLTSLVEQGMRKDSRRLYTCSTHHQRSQADQFRVTMRIDSNRQRIRGMRGPGTDWDFAAAIADEKIPIIAHEIGQFCVWPDFNEIEHYTGVLKAKNFELFRERLTEFGMLEQARDFLMASGKLQTLCYKEEIESMLRTPGFGGFQLLDLHDFPGQGTALVGVLNAFWGEKGYTSPEEYRRFCNATVPLARFAKRIWINNETLTARVDLAHFGETDMRQCTAKWTLTDGNGQTIDEGALPAVDVPAGDLTILGQIQVDLHRLKKPTAVKLTVSIPGTNASNDWNLWVYPDVTQENNSKELLITSKLDEQTLTTLAEGGRVVLLPKLESLKGRRENWQPIFWNTQWFKGGSNFSLGILCDPKHAALAGFPTAMHSDWQWHDLMDRSVAVDLGQAPTGLQPIVQVVPDWNHPRREALLLECKVGKGRLLVCSIDLTTDLGERPAARQLRKSLIEYAASQSFDPTITLTLTQLRSLLFANPNNSNESHNAQK
jgi:hypothetical protein